MAHSKVLSNSNVAYYHTYRYNSLQQLQRHGKMHGARRVIMFCLLMAVLPTFLLVIPLYLRHSVYADVIYAVAESDVLEIVDGISTVFCQAHSLKMNSSFHAFQLAGMPDLSPNRKHIRLKKSMSLPDDTLEYWGFYLLKGSTVVLSVCSRFQGSRVMVVKGEKNLRTCGLLDHRKEVAVHPHMASGQGQVRVTFDTEAQEIHSKQMTSPLVRTEQFADDDFEGENKSDDADNVSKELTDKDNITILEQLAEQHIRKRYLRFQNGVGSVKNNSSVDSQNETQHVRHARKRLSDSKISDSSKMEWNNAQKRHLAESVKYKSEVSRLNNTGKRSINGNRTVGMESEIRKKAKRAAHLTPTHLLDGGVEHGGNAGNGTEVDDTESSVSSFENSLLTCYDGHILLAESFLPSPMCTNVHVLEKHGTMETVHEVIEDGYYYYIFYSDNDYVQNDIYAIFNIHKPTYQYAKHSRACFNQTECTFPIAFLSDETVIVEVPTRDGIEHEDDDITFLVSSCYPRMSIYIIFPVAVLFLILGCAFM